MTDFNDLLDSVDEVLIETFFGEPALYDGGTVVDVVIDKAVPYSDEDGAVFTSIDELHIIPPYGVTIELGKTIQTDDKTYRINRFVRQVGKIKVFELA